MACGKAERNSAGGGWSRNRPSQARGTAGVVSATRRAVPRPRSSAELEHVPVHAGGQSRRPEALRTTSVRGETLACDRFHRKEPAWIVVCQSERDNGEAEAGGPEGAVCTEGVFELVERKGESTHCVYVFVRVCTRVVPLVCQEELADRTPPKGCSWGRGGRREGRDGSREEWEVGGEKAGEGGWSEGAGIAGRTAGEERVGTGLDGRSGGRRREERIHRFIAARRTTWVRYHLVERGVQADDRRRTAPSPHRGDAAGPRSPGVVREHRERRVQGSRRLVITASRPGAEPRTAEGLRDRM